MKSNSPLQPLLRKGDPLGRAQMIWVKEIPERWGVKPEVTILDPGPILCKEIVTRPENSWFTE
jgi:hypothetical protein